jgi:hypothetical protein
VHPSSHQLAWKLLLQAFHVEVCFHVGTYIWAPGDLWSSIEVVCLWVQVANRVCRGRVVSVLEGGYRVQGGVVSAFARSVAAHVHALAEPNEQRWDEHIVSTEREEERRARAARHAHRMRRAEIRCEQNMAHELAELAAEAAEDAGGAHRPAAPRPHADGTSKRRRGGAVDYVALNKQLDEAASTVSGVRS